MNADKNSGVLIGVYPCSSAAECSLLVPDAAAGHGSNNFGEVGPLFLGGCVGDKIAFGGEAAVDVPGDAGGDGAADVLSAGEHNHHHQAMRAHLVERTEPTHVAGGLEIRAGAGIAEDVLGSIVTGAPGGAEIDGAAHAELDIVDAGGSELEGM